MPVSLIPSFLLFCFTGAITPGPANLCSLTAAMKYGRKQALKQWRGLFVGFACVSLSSVLITHFLGEKLNNYVSYFAYIGAAYILWLAFKIFRDDRTAQDYEKVYNASDDDEIDYGFDDLEYETLKDAPCNFYSGLLVQLSNVKIMVFCLTALSSYVLPHTQSFKTLLLVGIFLPFTGPIANLVWLFAGEKLQGLFERHGKILNALMALSLVLCALNLILSVN